MQTNSALNNGFMPKLAFYLFTWLLISWASKISASENTTETLDNIAHVSIVSDGQNIEVRASVIVKLSAFEFVELLENAKQDCSWLDRCLSVTEEQASNDSSRRIRTVFASPWPFANREMLTESTHSFDHAKNILTIKIKNIEQATLQNKRNVMIEDVHGSWTVRPVSEDISEIHYQGYADPSGNIPRFLVDNLLLKSTTNTFNNIQTYAKQKNEKSQ